MRQILIMAIFLVQAFAASAQSNIEKVFKIVLNDPSTEVLSSSDYNVVCVDSGVSYCKFTEFTVPAKKNKGQEAVIVFVLCGNVNALVVKKKLYMGINL